MLVRYTCLRYRQHACNLFLLYCTLSHTHTQLHTHYKTKLSHTGVNHAEEDKLNPLHSILKKFTEDDFIVVKLDIDTSFIEKPLAYQILNNTGAGEYDYHKLIDQFYFEDHVHLKELAGSWGRSMDGTISDTLKLFSGLRSKGIPAHFWP